MIFSTDPVRTPVQVQFRAPACCKDREHLALLLFAEALALLLAQRYEVQTQAAGAHVDISIEGAQDADPRALLRDIEREKAQALHLAEAQLARIECTCSSSGRGAVH